MSESTIDNTGFKVADLNLDYKVADVNLPIYPKTRLQCGVSKGNPFSFVDNESARRVYREIFD